jgi:long-chain acyl-CoA synthetase
LTRKADEIAAHFGRLPTLEPASTAVRFQDRTFSWADLGAVADGIIAALRRANVPDHSAVGWLARNDPALIGALIGLIKGRYCVSPINPHQPATKAAGQLRELQMAALVGVERDFTAEVREALTAIGAIGLVLEAGGNPPVRLLDPAAQLGPGPFRNLGDDIVIERLTSGTTGEPKRIQVPAETFSKAVELGARSEKAGDKGELKVKRSPSILLTTFSHSGGMWGALLALNQARPIDLHEKFAPEAWADAVERTGTKAASLVPSMITMVLEAEVEPSKIQSLIAIRCGTAALDPETQRRFEERYKVPVLVELGASEFMGGIAGWSLVDHREHGVTKRGSVGRPRPDMEVCITDVETGDELPAGQTGVMNLKSPRAGPDWVRTTDLASLDVDGFLYLHGRADEAINRGGFKVLPDKVAEILRLHPAVREATVLAIKDARLGQVPVAFVETIDGEPLPTAADLQAVVRENAASYMVPVAVECVDALPRTLSLKIDRPALRARFKDKYDFS